MRHLSPRISREFQQAWVDLSLAASGVKKANGPTRTWDDALAAVRASIGTATISDAARQSVAKAVDAYATETLAAASGDTFTQRTARRARFAALTDLTAATARNAVHPPPAVERTPVNSDVFMSLGYNPTLELMELEFNARPGRIYSYRMSPHDYAAFRNSDDIENYYLERIRGNPSHTFTSAADAHAARSQIRCEECGRYINGTCPGPHTAQWSDHPDLLDAVAAETLARTNAELPYAPYRPENITNGIAAPGNRAFGIEYEFDLPNMTDEQKAAAITGIGRALYRMGLTDTVVPRDRDDPIHETPANEHTRGWRFKTDESCDGEFSSPLLHDTPETWDTIVRINEAFARYGAVASTRTGFHVHVSTPDYNPDSTALLVQTVNENEDLMLRLATNPALGEHRGTAHCSRNPDVDPTDPDIPGGERDVAVNLKNMTGDEQSHVEFRVFDGTTDPVTQQTQIMLALALTEYAAHATTPPPSASGPAGTHLAARTTAGFDREADSRSVRSFLDAVFARDEDKAALAALYSVNKWQNAR